ncbi:DUF2079 domain-containing protein [Aeromicrobium wangtongii]|uniref:DUF2079 domain-containing protein n=1 Tax=Aeromicrobium wangtongii TaxID=2969247 RepID=A0ABY5M8M9_9ACTN|nr:DUF2079 domain-containing protein [Aeromicrobium wangtongii]MCD9196994.1 DUF2079 domain-containing protein [Aeromicrobium wangtongii]UUP14495.1 DUF2079 domain-containing protein [Aeromicrobium wangtongii]
MTASRAQHALAGALALVCAVAYGALTLIRFHRFAINSFDNAIFEQVIKSYSRLSTPVADVKGPGYNIFGDHFSPVTALIAPFYRAFPSAQTVLLAQVVLIAISIYVIALLAMRRLGTPLGLVIGILYGFSFGLQSAVQVNFHEVAFAAPLLAMAGAAYVDRRYDRVVWWSLPLLLVKEDLGLTVAVIGAVLWLAGERRRGVVLALVGVLGSALLVLVVIPAFNGSGEYTHSTLGERGLLTTLFDQVDRKAATVLLTVGITGLAALASPWVLLILPTLAGRFINDVPYYWGTEYHYSLVLMPVVFVAMIDAMVRWPRLRWATVVGVVVSGFMMINSPLSVLVESETYEDPPRADSARLVLSLVPKGASVEGDIGLLSHLVTDHTTYWVGTVGSGDVKPEYVLFDVQAPIGSPKDVAAYAEKAHGGTYDVIFERDGYVLAQRR